MEIDYLFTAIFIIPVLGFMGSSFQAIILKDKIPKLIFNVGIILALVLELIFSFFLYDKLKGERFISPDFTNNIGYDWIGLVFTLFLNLIFLIAGVYSFAYIDEEKQSRFFTLFFTLQLGSLLIVSSTHLFLLFIFWELMVISGYALVSFNQGKEAFEAGMKYLVISSFGSLLLLLGISLLTGVADGLYFHQIANTTGLTETAIGKLAVALIIFGFGVTGGIVIMNQWLPDAHPAAPAPISAILSGLIVKLGIYGIFRFIDLTYQDIDFNISTTRMLIFLGLLTMTEGNIMVVAQLLRSDNVDFKRILAYSTTVHLGYLLLIVGIQSDGARVALLYHIINHGLAKALLFLLAGYCITKWGTRSVPNLQGIGRNDKIFTFALFVSLMSLGGLPLTGGFISKLLLLISTFDGLRSQLEMSFYLSSIIIIIAITNSVFAFGGYLWIYKKFVLNPPNETPKVKPLSKSQELIFKSMFLSISLFILVLGIFPSLILNNIEALIPS